MFSATAFIYPATSTLLALVSRQILQNRTHSEIFQMPLVSIGSVSESPFAPALFSPRSSQMLFSVKQLYIYIYINIYTHLSVKLDVEMSLIAQCRFIIAVIHHYAK